MLQQSKLFIFITASWIILTGCEEKIKTNIQAPTIEVGVITIQEQAIALQQELTGRVKAKLVSEVRPQIGGIITKQLFTEGSFVNQGEILYQIDSASYQASFFQAKASLESAKVDAKNAKIKSQRYEELLKFANSDQKEVEDFESILKKIFEVIDSKIIMITDEEFIEKEESVFRGFKAYNMALEKIKELNEFVTKKISQNKELVITETYSYDQEINGEKNIPDSEGERAANATKFYKKASDKASWVYLGDRSLLAIEAYENNFVKVSVPNRKEFLYVKKNQFKYTRTTKFNSLIEKVIVVDRTNQNTQLFDYVGGEFLLTHSSKSTTGYNNNNNSYRTPRGFYIVSNVKPYMMYFDDAKKPDETKKLGRALYAVRFSGGYYLHGIPLKDELKGKERDATRKRVEAILGSHPSSHGCVRNSDEDAKFIYDWTNPIAIRKDYFVPTFPVAVIITD